MNTIQVARDYPAIRQAWQTIAMSDLESVSSALREQGALFAYVHGSVAAGTAMPDSDLDIAAYFSEPAPANFTVKLPENVDLLVLNDCALELAGRVALDGQLFLVVDEVAWVRWESTTRKIYLDEKYRIDRSHREFLESLTHG